MRGSALILLILGIFIFFNKKIFFANVGIQLEGFQLYLVTMPMILTGIYYLFEKDKDDV
jgi:hypothetical protein